MRDIETMEAQLLAFIGHPRDCVQCNEVNNQPKAGELGMRDLNDPEAPNLDISGDHWRATDLKGQAVTGWRNDGLIIGDEHGAWPAGKLTENQAQRQIRFSGAWRAPE